MKPVVTLWTILTFGLLLGMAAQTTQAAQPSAIVARGSAPNQQRASSQPVLAPPTPQPSFSSGTALGTAPLAPARPAGSCPNLIPNGDFEQDSDWWTYPEPNVTYDTDYASSGQQSISLQTFDGTTTTLWQRITIPANASQITLDFDSIVLTGAVDQNVIVSLYNTNFAPVQSFTLLYPCDCEWFHFAPVLDVAQLAGRTLNLEFEVNAAGTIDEVNFDNVVLGVCQNGPTATPLPLPRLLAPTGEITAHTPTFSWAAMPGAVSYLLWANESGPPFVSGKIELNLLPAAANCAEGTTCTVAPGVRFKPTGGQWWITAYFNDGKIASESEGSSFTINLNATATPTATPTPTLTAPPTPTPTATATTPPPPSPTATPLPTARDTPPVTPPNTATPTATPTAIGVGDAYEADDRCADARAISADGNSQRRTFHRPADVDWVRFEATTQTTYRIEVLIPDGSAADVVLELHIGCDTLPAEQWRETFAPGVRLDFKATASGPIFLRFNNQAAEQGDDTVRYDLSVRPLADQPKGGAVIIVAGRLRANDALQRNIHYVTDRVYQIFQAQGYTNEDITYLATDAGLTGYDAAATKENLRNAITEWATAKVGANQALTIYLMDHGGVDKFYLDGANQLIVTPAELNEWLSTFEARVPSAVVNVILEACYIGSFISPPDSISKPNRVVIASSDDNWSAYASRDGAYFSDHFLTSLQQGRNLFSSFAEAQQNVSRYFAYQNPWLDANGDGLPNQQHDFVIAAERGFAYAGTLAADHWPPYIAQVTTPHTIDNQRGQLSAEVRDDEGVDSVWAVVYAPTYVAPNNAQELTAENVPTILLTAQNNDHYTVEYPAFSEVGTYRILIHAKDRLGNLARPVELTVAVGSRVYLPLVVR